MDPSVRSYNSNSSGQPRRRASKSNKRPSDAPAQATTRKTRSNPPARKAVVETLLEPAAPTNEAAPERADLVEEIGEQAASHAAAEAGPVVTIADFEDIFARFQTPLINFVFRLVGNREQACDLTQDVFVKAYRALSSGTTIQSAALSSWLYRIASNTATDALRRRRLISWLPLSLFNEDRGVGAGMPGMEGNGTNQQGPSEDVLASAANAFSSGYDGGRFEQHVADREIVESVLKRLPPKYAACLLLYEHEGFSCAEIAEVLNVSPSAVKMRLMRARERFITLYRQEVSGQ
jgi:RNA polymerase sigma-70 factor, ECF subfamily